MIYVVAKDGSGDFTSVQQAVDALPICSDTPNILVLRMGEYPERVVADKSDVRIGDILALICAVFYSVQIILIDRFLAQGISGVQLSLMEFIVGSVISLILMFIFEHPVIGDIMAASPALLYSGIMSCGIAYTLQIVGQKYTNPVVASILMCLESVFAVIAAWLILHEQMSSREACGCIIMFIAIILSQVPEWLSSKKKAALP